MRFSRTVTKREKKNETRKRLAILLIFISLIVINIAFAYKVFFEKPKPIVNPLSKNQESSTQLIVKKLKDENIEILSIKTENNLNFAVKLNAGGEVILDPGKSIDKQISSLQLILSQLKIEGKTIKRLDFTYDKPIIAFE